VASRSMASLILVRNVVGELRPKRTLAALRGFLAAARLSCSDTGRQYNGGVEKTSYMRQYLEIRPPKLLL